MRRVAGLVLWAWAAAAIAADKPVLAPPGAWVHPAPLPAIDAAAGEAAIRILLTDQQLRLSPQGDELYVESVVRLQTPQGLATFGTISLPWKPDTMTLTVHKLHVVRAGKVIDLLGAGHEFTVLRRENDLEHAVLDGVLTATLQPEGLQVGDVIDMASTLKSADPALRGMSQGVIGGAPVLPVGQYRARALWASDLPVHWRVTGALPPFRETRAGGMTEIGFIADNVQPAILPKGAPARFAFARGVELTSFRTWGEVAALFAPLYAKSATLGPDSPLQAESSR